MINSIAKKLKTRARIAFRLNPRVNAKTHKHISTGNKTHKFGLLKEDILEALRCDITMDKHKPCGIKHSYWKPAH